MFLFHAHGNTRVRSKRHRIPPSQVSFGWRKRPAAFHLLSHACTQPQNCVIWPLSISLGVVARLSLLQLSKNPSHLTAGKGQVAGYTHTDKSLLGHSAPSLLRGMRKCNLENLPVWGDVRQKILERRWECLVAHFESYQQLVITQGTPLKWPAGILWLSSHLFACPLPSCSVRDLLVSSADAIPHTAPWAGSPVLTSFNTNVFCGIKFKCLKMWDLHKFPMLSSDRNF